MAWSSRNFLLKLEVLTLKTDSHDIIFWSFFSFLKLLSPVKIVLSMALYFQIVNNTGSAENSFLYNSKVIKLTVNGRSFPKRTLKTIYYGWFIQWSEILPCTLTGIAPHSRVIFSLWCVMAYKMSAWCVIGTPPSPPPPSASFATLYQHSPIRLILRGSPTRSRTLGTRFMDPTKPPTHPNSHRLSAEKRSPLRLSRTCLTILHPFAKPEMKVIQFFRRTAIRCVRSSGVRLFAIFSSFLHFKSVIMSLWPREIKFKPRIKLGHNIVSHVEILPRGNNNTNMCKKLHCR